MPGLRGYACRCARPGSAQQLALVVMRHEGNLARDATELIAGMPWALMRQRRVSPVAGKMREAVRLAEEMRR